MKRTRKIALTVVAGAVAGGALIAVPAIANTASPTPGPQTQSREWVPGQGMMGRQGGPGQGTRLGTCCLQDGTILPSGTLTAAQKKTLAWMAEEEKLAHDLYAAFADQYDTVVFDRIAAAETQHLAAVRTLLSRYGIADPTAGKAEGKFASASFQSTYDRLLAQGKAGEQAALRVGQSVEKDDVAALDKALGGLDAPDVERVYTQLRRASQTHLNAFERWID